MSAVVGGGDLQHVSLPSFGGGGDEDFLLLVVCRGLPLSFSIFFPYEGRYAYLALIHFGIDGVSYAATCSRWGGRGGEEEECLGVDGDRLLALGAGGVEKEV